MTQLENEQKSLYQATHAEIFTKNFLAGFARALGGVFVQILFFATLYFIFMRFLSPIVTPLFATLEKSVNALESIQNQQNQLKGIFPFGSNTPEIDPNAPVMTR